MFPREQFVYASTSPWITFLINPRLVIDSPYDRKQLRFKTGLPTEKSFERISLFRRPLGEGGDSAGAWEFDLDFFIPSAWRTFLFWGALIGILLWLPQLLAIRNTKNMENPWLVAGAYLIAYLTASILAAFKIKKPI